MVKRITTKRAASEAEAPEVEDYDDFRELEDALRIDEHALERALRDQPVMFYRVANAYALEISRRDAAKQALQDVEAEADLSVRGRAQRDDQKITEGQIRATVQTDGRVAQAQASLARRSEAVGKLAALKEAFQQRSYALKDLAGLYVANYYTASEHNAASGAVRTRDAAEARARMSEARNARK
ncbi:MAG: hypothetical protein Q8R92_06220 [Deltaproteobacteria bacterium]|nr:hypothetical protein [Deltaproteobacteria bacterium]